MARRSSGRVKKRIPDSESDAPVSLARAALGDDASKRRLGRTMFPRAVLTDAEEARITALHIPDRLLDPDSAHRARRMYTMIAAGVKALAGRGHKPRARLWLGAFNELLRTMALPGVPLDSLRPANTEGRFPLAPLDRAKNEPVTMDLDEFLDALLRLTLLLARGEASALQLVDEGMIAGRVAESLARRGDEWERNVGRRVAGGHQKFSPEEKKRWRRIATTLWAKDDAEGRPHRSKLQMANDIIHELGLEASTETVRKTLR